MSSEINTMNFGSVNCYLVKSGTSFIRIDTGLPNKRNELERAGCQVGNLKLKILTLSGTWETVCDGRFRKKLPKIGG